MRTPDPVVGSTDLQKLNINSLDDVDCFSSFSSISPQSHLDFNSTADTQTLMTEEYPFKSLSDASIRHSGELDDFFAEISQDFGLCETNNTIDYPDFLSNDDFNSLLQMPNF